MTAARQTRIGLALAGAIAAAWLAVHIYGVFFLSLSGSGLLVALALIALQTWLNVGLFIVAHDAMHGSLAPGRPAVNAWTGRAALALYAGFSFDRLRPKHFAHHSHAGTANDPDFSATHPRRFWPWYLGFFRQYFGLREFAVLSLVVALYLFVLRAEFANLILLWALPAILSSLQLFAFGTFLPHRHHDEPFGDRHNARSNDYGWFASLLSCFHFGYHHEHHCSPGTPWWRLPAERVKAAQPR